MKVRLAFAVAAHLEPEILIIDEVLAVGDAEFQKKCLGKMQDVASHGRTVLFVSHNMAAVQQLCTKGLVLSQGRQHFLGSSSDSVSEYLSSKTSSHTGSTRLDNHPSRRGGAIPVLRAVRFLNRYDEIVAAINTGDPLTIEFEVASQTPLRTPQIGIGFDCSIGGRIFSATTYHSGDILPTVVGNSIIRCHLDSLPLLPGRYYLSLSAGTGNDTLLDAIDEAVHLDIAPGDYFQNGKIPAPSLGRVAVRSRWTAR